ncbi:MAG: Spx/MgsR family RNA polymerase-binding regulatory protein [Chitinophagia bacterium]|jgi:Spx/MgsR family transcriptional regulator
MYKLYGIPNCNSVKKATQWLQQNGISYTFHNYQKSGIDEQKLMDWSKQIGWPAIINRKGTTWKKNAIENEKQVSSEKGTLALLTKQTSMIKRPIIELSGKVLAVGFDEDLYLQVFL